MEVQNMNPNPKRSRMNETEVINNPYKPISPFIPFIRGPSGAARSMAESLPYGANTINQELTNMRNEQLNSGTRNQQMFGQTIYSQNFPGMPRN